MRVAVAALVGLAALAAPAAAQDGRVGGRDPEAFSVVGAPGAIRPYAIIERRPSIVTQRRVPLGDVLPDSVDAYAMPGTDLGYVVLDGARYVIDSQRRVVDALD